MKQTTKNKYARIVDEVCVFIADNYHVAGLELKDFSKAMGYSQRTVQRAMLYRDLSWQQTLKHMRLENAWDMINNHIPVSTACHAVGYVNLSEFSKAFKSAYGQTPTEFLERRNGHG